MKQKWPYLSKFARVSRLDFEPKFPAPSKDMILVEKDGTGFYHSHDKFDSGIFGLRVGKVELMFGHDFMLAQKLIKELVDQKLYDYIVFRYPQEYSSWIQATELAGGYFLDTTVHLSKTPKANDSESNLEIRDAKDEDQETLIEMTKAFKFGRFFSDPYLNKGSQIYRKWVENCLLKVAADDVFVALKDKKILGFVATKYKQVGEQKVLSVQLIAKSPATQVPGVGKELLKYVEQKAVLENCAVLLLNTQGTNIAALRTYSDMGYNIFHSDLTLGYKS